MCFTDFLCFLLIIFMLDILKGHGQLRTKFLAVDKLLFLEFLFTVRTVLSHLANPDSNTPKAEELWAVWANVSLGGNLLANEAANDWNETVLLIGVGWLFSFDHGEKNRILWRPKWEFKFFSIFERNNYIRFNQIYWNSVTVFCNNFIVIELKQIQKWQKMVKLIVRVLRNKCTNSIYRTWKINRHSMRSHKKAENIHKILKDLHIKIFEKL